MSTGPTKIRVRVAPSPTGYLHIGTARTALFNYLFSRQHNGQFLLRIDDTDKQRSKKEFEKDILDNLRWLGLNWDNKSLIHQSQRQKIYQKYLDELIKNKKAYYCYCSKDRLKKSYQEQIKNKRVPRYDGYCRQIRNRPQADWQTIRLNVDYLASDQETIHFKDEIRGDIATNHKTLDDFVIANSKTALYNFTSVIDDHKLGITHIIRGEDHIANTPKQILIFRALGFDLPKFAHLPLILNPDRTKMSKRVGNTRVADYRAKGYLAPALINFLTLLGWHPKDNQEIFSLTDLIKKFNLKEVQKSGAIFDIKKLNWLNNYYIKQLPEKDYGELSRTFVDGDKTINRKVAWLFKDRLNCFAELKELTARLIKLPDYRAEILVWQKTPVGKIIHNLKFCQDVLQFITIEKFKVEYIETKLKQGIEANNLTNGEVLWPLRVALSGQEKSPSPFEIAAALGPDETNNRIKLAIKKISNLK